MILLYKYAHTIDFRETKCVDIISSFIEWKKLFGIKIVFCFFLQLFSFAKVFCISYSMKINGQFSPTPESILKQASC